MQPQTTSVSNPEYEFKAVGVLALGLGMVGLDRFIRLKREKPCSSEAVAKAHRH